jgi:hypothetical protein
VHPSIDGSAHGPNDGSTRSTGDTQPDVGVAFDAPLTPAGSDAALIVDIGDGAADAPSVDAPSNDAASVDTPGLSPLVCGAGEVCNWTCQSTGCTGTCGANARCTMVCQMGSSCELDCTSNSSRCVLTNCGQGMCQLNGVGTIRCSAAGRCS